MKKVNISIAYEEEKYAALTMYLTQKNMSLETELTAALDSLYAKQVPPAVRDFVSQRISSEQKKEKRNRISKGRIPFEKSEIRHRNGNDGNHPSQG